MNNERDGSRPWDVARFVRTVTFFNPVPTVSEVVTGIVNAPFRMFQAQTTTQDEADIKVLIGAGRPDSRRAILVTGATGGLGRRVVALLLRDGQRVRALVRNVPKATQLLQGLPAGPAARLEVVAADLSQPATLQPALFEGVGACISCAAARIRPRGGSAEDVDNKYYEGTTFHEPHVADNSPKAVDHHGTAALVDVLAGNLGTSRGQELLDASNVSSQWGALDDVVMGGRSESGLFTSSHGGEHGEPVAVFRGFVTSAGNGGFASVRTRNFEPPLNLSGFDGLRFRVKGDGQRYKFTLRTETSWDGVGYTASLDTKAGEWHDLELPFAALVPVFRARTSPSSPPFNPSHITSIQIMLSKFEYDGSLNPNISMGAFELPIQSIAAYTKADVPRFVHVSSAGVTRPNRPDLAPEADIKIVHMNDALGGLLTCKLAAEDAIRESGIPFAIVRPCALTEEPPGAPVLVDQGDNLSGKASRDDVAELCVHLLNSHTACNCTFEIKSDLPVQESWKAVPGAAPRNWEAVLKAANLRSGVTGKTIRDVYAGKTAEVDVLRQVACKDLMAE